MRAPSTLLPAPRADAYATALWGTLAAAFAGADDPREALSRAIGDVSHRPRVSAGEGPSSTVLVLQRRVGHVEIAVLGDSTAVIGFYDGSAR